MIVTEGPPVTPPRRSLAWTVYKFMSSIKLACVLLVALGAILAVATFYESLYDSKTAQHLVYGSPWFALFLGTLFVNIFCSTTIRYPWKSHQVGFVITHLGILFILTGSLQTLLYGIDGQMPIVEGGANDKAILDRPVLLWGPSSRSLREVEAEFRWHPPTPERPYRVELGSGVTARVESYLHHARGEMQYEASAHGDPAVHLQFKSSRFNIDQWLSPHMGEVQMGLARVSLMAATQADIDRLLAQPDNAPLQDVPGSLGMLVQGRPLQVAASEFTGPGRMLDDSPYTLRIVRYLPGHDNPSLEVEVSGPEGRQTHTLWAKEPARNQSGKPTGQAPDVRLLYVLNQNPASPPPRQGKSLKLYVTPEARLYVSLNGRKVQPLVAQQPLATGWMDIVISAAQILPSAHGHEVYTAFHMKKGQKEGPPAALRVTLEGALETRPFWLQQGGALHQSADMQGNPFLLGYSYRSVPVGVRIELHKFEVAYDPGTRNPASFKSTVKVRGAEHLIEMNEPLHIDNYTFYQASYQENESGPQTSVLAVTYDPGIFSKYLGSILLVGGIFIMFYIKPLMLKRRKRAQS